MTEQEAFYRMMLRIRRIEEAIATYYVRQEMRCPMHLSIGQEAIAVGVCSRLRQVDGVFSSHRAHAHYLAKGGSLVALLAELLGLEAGCCRGVGGSMHLIDLPVGFLGSVPIVGATVPLAVGTAWASHLRQDDAVTTVFFGDGTFEEGVVHEALNFSVLHRLPILFVCENNLYACYTRLEDRQPSRPIHGVAKAHGCKVIVADGNDVAAVADATSRSIEHLRRGEGPAFLELPTYRWREHCGPNDDDALGYRPIGELAHWEATCPVSRLGSEIKTTPGGADFIETSEAEIADEIANAFALALKGNAPTPADLDGYLYA